MKYLALIGLISTLALTACDDGSAENLGEEIDRAASNVGNEIDRVANDVGNAVEDLCEEVTDRNCD